MFARLQQRWSKSFVENPMAWILAGLLAFSVFSHYRTGTQFTEVCNRILMLREGYFDLETSRKFITTGIDLDSMMAEVKRHEELMKAKTAEGRAYRWWRYHGNKSERICSDRMAEDSRDPRDE